MELYLDGHSLEYEMTNLCFLFFPGEHVKVHGADEKSSAAKTEHIAYTRIRRHGERTSALVLIKYEGQVQKTCERFTTGTKDFNKQCELALGRVFYRAASKICGFCPPWGILTGIRPVKLVRSHISAGESTEKIVDTFSKRYYLSGEKTRLCLETANAEDKILSLSRKNSVSLYISIPFCPTRCLYCSFISQNLKNFVKVVPDYVRLLCREIEETGKLIRELGLHLETVYMGGGTPTSLSAEQLTAIFDTIRRSVTLDTVREYTVEAGRPDTITSDKLAAISAAGAGRISVNPQTLDDDVLKRIGRGHTVKDFFDACGLVRESGIPCVNMDVIAGLPGDTPEGFVDSLARIIAMRPQNITVHTLALKRSSRLVISGAAKYSAHDESAEKMVGDAARMLHEAGYLPYYLYRQRNMIDNLENVGWSLPGCEGLYNVYIMDETHTILAAGAGGTTKLRQPGGDSH